MKMTREIGLSKQFSFDNIKSYFQTPEDLRGRSTTDSGRTDTGGSTNSSTAGKRLWLHFRYIFDLISFLTSQL